MTKQANALQSESGFTLVEIMIVVLIMSVLMMIAIPGWLGARDRTQARTCTKNLREIRYAKESWAMDLKKGDSETPAWADIQGYLKSQPACPGGGTYTIGSVSTDPLCSLAGDHVIN